MSPNLRRSSFDGIPFATGSMVGLRAFSVNADDPFVLRGVSYRAAFDPGVNEAIHLSYDDTPVSLEDLEEGHEVAQLNCQCGFWAYYNGNNSAAMPKAVAAVVEGFGRVTYGTEGFRASKMRLLGVIREPFMRVVVRGCDCAVCSGKIIRGPQIEAIAARYGVPLYPNHDAAIAAHPLTAPPAPADGESAGGEITTWTPTLTFPTPPPERPSKWYFG